MIIRLLDREPRADSRTFSASEPTRITQASNFSFESRLLFSPVIGTTSMPNWRKHSESMLREDSCKSTRAALAENFFEQDRATREFPKVFSVFFGSRPVPLRMEAGRSVETPFWRGNRAIAIANKDNIGHVDRK